MPRRIPSVFLLIVLVLVAAAAALLAWRGDEALRLALERQLQSRLVPTVTIDGPVDWQLAPQPTLVVRNMRLRDAAGETLVTVREVAVVVEPDSWSERRLALATVDIDGVEARLRYVDGHWDAAGWLHPMDAGADGAPGVAVPIGRMRLADARVEVDGEFAAVFEDLHVEAGPLHPGMPSRIELRAAISAAAPLDAQLQLGVAAEVSLVDNVVSLGDAEGNLRGRVSDWELAHGAIRAGRIRIDANGPLRAVDVALSFAARRLDLQPHPRTSAARHDARGSALGVDGQASFAALTGQGASWRGAALQADFQVEHDGRVFGARLASADATLRTDGWQLPALNLELTSSGAAPPAHVTLTGELAGGLGAAPRHVVLRVAQADVELPHPAGQATPLSVSLSARAQFDPHSGAGEGEVAGRFDQSRFDGRWGFDPTESLPLEFDLTLDRLDLDRYLPPATAGQEGADLAMWRNWPVRADLQVGELRMRGFVTTNARLLLQGAAVDAADATSAR